MDPNQEQSLGKRQEPVDGGNSGVKTDKVKKSLKDIDKDFVPKKSDFNPLDDVIVGDGEVSSEHSSYNDENFDKEDFLNFVRQNLAKKREEEAGSEEEEEAEWDEEEAEEEAYSDDREDKSAAGEDQQVASN